MRMIWQAIRAVTVEVMGVGAVLFMLFSGAGWTMESAGVRPMQEVDRAWQWLQHTTAEITAPITPSLTAEQRQRFAAERLDHYGSLYVGAANAKATYAVRALPGRAAPADQSPALRPNQLLGTL